MGALLLGIATLGMFWVANDVTEQNDALLAWFAWMIPFGFLVWTIWATAELVFQLLSKSEAE